MKIQKYESPEHAHAVMGMIIDELDQVIPNRYSSNIVMQLTYSPYVGMNYFHQFIISEIKHLEDKTLPTQTIDEELFNRQEMKGLWKKHFFLPQFFAKNVENIWGLSKDSRSTKFNDTFQKDCKKYAQSPTQEKALEFNSLIASKITKETQSKKKTGEYIVFQKHEEQNYYLCLGIHRQDEEILSWVESAYTDFPFLKNEPK